MQLQGDLAVVQARATELGLRVVADECWLVRGFLAEATLSPRRYLDLAERHKALQRQLFALTARLLTDAPPRLVA